MTEQRDKLFREFPPVSTSAWDEKIRADLKGADYDRKLIWRTIEGINIKPFYRSEDINGFDYQQALPGTFPFVRGAKTKDNRWQIRQQILVEDIAAANKKALDLSEKGVTSLEFVLTKKVVLTPEALERLLNNLPLPAVALNFTGYQCETTAALLMPYTNEHNIKPEALKGSINFDPLGRLCIKGNFHYDSEALSVEMLVNVINDTQSLSAFRTIGINARNFVNAGSSIIQELAFSLAMGAEYLSMLADRGLSVKEAAIKMAFYFAVSPNYFMEIAKFRAARLLWAQIVKAFDPGCHESMCIHAETSCWNFTVYDPYVNILRTTTESMSAILAGIDSLTILPFDIAYEKPTEFAERIARNQQIMLKEESYLDRVIDPAAGSYYIESLTESIAVESWKIFLAVQEKGGFIAAMKQGYIQEQVGKTAQQRDLAIATRREVSIGTNQYPNFAEVCQEKPVDYIPACVCNAGKSIVQPLCLYRATEKFEKLRLRTDLGGRRPGIFMLTIGNQSMRLARSQFSCNFFACAGYEVIDNTGFNTLDEGIMAAVAAKADVVVLCSSDDEIAVFAPEAYEKLKGRAILVIAGSPPCMEDLKAKGIDNFIHIRSDVLETLKAYHQKLGIE